MEQTERDLLELSDQVTTLGEYFTWTLQCAEFVEQLETRARNFRSSAKRPPIGQRQSLVVRIARLEVNTAFNGEFVAGDKRDNKSICTNNIELCRTSHLRDWYERHVTEPTLAKFEEFQERDSGWALTRILNLTVNVNKYNPLRVGCHLELSKDIKVKNAVINVLSMDNACFAWVLDLRDIEFPMTLSQIKQFERLNNISVNVYYTIEGQKTSNVLPIRLTDRTSVKKHVNLLYVQDPRDNNVGHFAWIKNLSRLVSSQLSKHHGQKCLHYFSSSDKLQSHTVDCRKKTQPETEHASYAYQHHRVCSIAYYVQCSYDETLSAYRFRHDNDCVAWFVEELKGLAHRVKNILSDIVCMVDLTRDEWETFHSAAQCHICEKPFAPNDNRVRDHCHLTGRYRGPAHSTCNLNYKDSHFIPVIFHNLSGYDAHFIIKEIAAAFEGKIDVLPITKENSLTGDTISESDYAHAANVWQRFSVRTLGEYSDLYLKTDVLLLADMFENFRNSCVASYGLDPAYYYILPGFTWDAMLKHTCVNFELLTDIDMVMFIERGIRGGLRV
ncbi:uncharacterized protein LOC143906629 [Temnothorax americanus]|uniref:uncharacterized protein LOC143906629 n=1 Tax=Temnothorax americanus TaxID=1964332 RepID=UPI0040682121